jgi:hypothetical protein
MCAVVCSRLQLLTPTFVLQVFIAAILAGVIASEWQERVLYEASMTSCEKHP